MLQAIRIYFLKRKISAPDSHFTPEIKGSKVGVLFNNDVEDKQALLEQIQQHFKISNSEINALGFSHKSFKNKEQPQDVFTLRDFSIFGEPKSESVQNFLKTDYQLLFNFFGSGELGLGVIAKSANAKLKVGLSTADERLNDLLLDMDSKNMDFFKASSTYIQHIIK